MSTGSVGPEESRVELARSRYQPPTAGDGLASVLPAAMVSLGAELPDGIPAPLWSLPEARRVVVVLVDGLGRRQLERRGGHAPTLSAMASPVADFRCGFPSTTSTSLTSLGTGRCAGEHGIVGWQTAVRGQTLFNHLAWKDGPDPGDWQPHRTMLQEAGRRDITVTTVSRAMFDGSGFTRAALRGGGFLHAETAEERLAGVRRALRGAGRRGRALVYAYWDEVDKAGHLHGPDSLEWGAAVEEVDAFVASLLQAVADDGCADDTQVVVTADHGMVDTPVTQRRDVAGDPVLGGGVRIVAGEPRAPQLWCEPGAVDDVVATWGEVLGPHALVLRREEAVEAGWFGPVEERVLPRIGEVVAAMLERATVVDSPSLRPEVLRLRGHHGSVTDEETAIPLLVGP